MNELFIGDEFVKKQYEIASKLQKINKGRLASVITFGCQQNENDSERIAGALKLCGYTVTDNTDCAELIIINTCAIREHAEIRALSEAGQFKNRRISEKHLKIGLCGCMAQQSHRRDQIRKSYPYIDFIFGTDMLWKLPEILQTVYSSAKRVTFINELPHNEFGTIAEGMPVMHKSNYKAWVPVMYGCNNFCSYCVVPYARGRERSRNREAVTEEVKNLVASGYKDITLLGQNVNSYSGGCDFASLLDECASFGGEYRMRFMTSHPKDASDALIDVIASNANVAKHFHLPVQSGSDRILKLMNRKYTCASYMETAFKIKEKIKNISLTTDIIVGFPGETEEDFEQTMSLVRDVGFDMIYTFIYSPRIGTVAASMEGQVPKDISNARFKRLTELENDIAQAYSEGFIGKELRVLSEGVNKNGAFCGRSTQNKIVTFDKPVPAGTLCNVRIDSAGAYQLGGKITD